eukprot:4148868-Amphidinium_carterae.1
MARSCFVVSGALPPPLGVTALAKVDASCAAKERHLAFVIDGGMHLSPSALKNYTLFIKPKRIHWAATRNDVAGVSILTRGATIQQILVRHKLRKMVTWETCRLLNGNSPKPEGQKARVAKASQKKYRT